MRGVSEETKEKQRFIVGNLVSESRGHPVKKISGFELKVSSDGGMMMAVVIW